MVTLASTFGNLARIAVVVLSKRKQGVPAFNYNNQSRNCYNYNLARMLSVSSAMSRTIAAVVSKQKPAVAASKYNNQSRNCYNNNHIRMLSHSNEIASSAITHAKIIKAVDEVTEESIENTSNKRVMDDYSNSKTDGIEVFVKALEHEGVTHITYFTRNKYVRRFVRDVFRLNKVIDLLMLDIETFTYCTATGFADADRGHRDRPGVCCISADSALVVNDVMVKCGGRGPVVFILVPFGKADDAYSLRFNNDAYTSLPHYYRVLDVRDITSIVQQAFSFAYNEPGSPVFIDIQHLLSDHVDSEEEEDLRTEAEIVVDYLRELCPSVILYVSSSLDDGVEQQKKELSRFLELTGIQVTRSLVGLGNAVTVLYVGATCNDLPEILTVTEVKVLLLVDVGDEEEMQKFIKPRGRLTTFPTFKEINEILVAEGIRFDDDFSCWGRLFLEIQRQTEQVLASCYADINSTATANNDKRITKEFAIHVLDEFFEDNKENVVVYRGDKFFKYGANSARPEKDVYLVMDGFEKGKVVNWYCCECVIILDNSGWTKRFYQETRKLFIRNFRTRTKSTLADDVLFEEHVAGEVVTDKRDLKNALYQYHESPSRRLKWLVVAVVPPADRFIEAEIPNFSRDLRFFNYPNAYLWKLVDRSPLED